MLNFILVFLALLCGVLIYRKGLIDGLELNKGKDIAPIKIMPKIFDFKPKKEEKPDLIREGLENILSYTGDPQPKPEKR